MTTATATLAEARRRGVNLAERDGRLAVDSPREAFTADLRKALIANKVEILDLLRSEAAHPAECPTGVLDQVAASGTSQAPPFYSWPPRPKQLARWPLAKRELWGRRANRLEDEGLDWRAAEQQAYIEVAGAYGESRSPEAQS